MPDSNPSDFLPAELCGLKCTSPVDLDQIGELYRKKAVRRSAIYKWAMACPPELRKLDIAHPGIAHLRAFYEPVLNWTVQPKGWIISGPTGCAKSRVCYALCLNLAKQSRDITYMHAQDVVSEIQERQRFGRDESAHYIKKLALAPILFLDDIGQEVVKSKDSEWISGWLFRLFDLRYGAQLPLISTTNLRASELANRTENIRAEPLLRRILAIANPVNLWPAFHDKNPSNKTHRQYK